VAVYVQVVRFRYAGEPAAHHPYRSHDRAGHGSFTGGSTFSMFNGRYHSHAPALITIVVFVHVSHESVVPSVSGPEYRAMVDVQHRISPPMRIRIISANSLYVRAE
jgi:hypothetical protein